jgi:hypothetical protein
MRTVHETEALRPSDPIPKSMQPAKTSRRLKLILKSSQIQAEENHPGTPNGTTNGTVATEWTSEYPPELGFTPEEEARGLEGLWRYLRRELVWAEQESEGLKRQCEEMEQLRKKEWKEKEVLLDQVINSEVSYHERRKEVLAIEAQLFAAEELKAAAIVAATASPSATANSPAPLAVKTTPVVEDRSEAAAVLASMRQV